jgi:hypothetical protein
METLQRWHDIVSSGDPSRLPEILTEDCVFISPVVHTPQLGRDITVLYLTGAMQVLKDGFHYLREVSDEHNAVLEFECKVDDIVVNGVDMLAFADDGRIREFKVMVRPLKAINMLHAKMGAMLESLKSA